MTELCEIEPMIEELKDFKNELGYEARTQEENELKSLFSQAAKNINDSICILEKAVKFMKNRGQTY